MLEVVEVRRRAPRPAGQLPEREPHILPPAANLRAERAPVRLRPTPAAAAARPHRSVHQNTPTSGGNGPAAPAPPRGPIRRDCSPSYARPSGSHAPICSSAQVDTGRGGRLATAYRVSSYISSPPLPKASASVF